MSALFRPWPDYGSLPDSATQRPILKSDTVPAAGSEAMFRRVCPAGFQRVRLSARVCRGVLFFVIAVCKIFWVQLCRYYTQVGEALSSRRANFTGM